MGEAAVGRQGRQGWRCLVRQGQGAGGGQGHAVKTASHFQNLSQMGIFG